VVGAVDLDVGVSVAVEALVAGAVLVGAVLMEDEIF
jgi:hypothetical protein